jgi:hypothetical protein
MWQAVWCWPLYSRQIELGHAKNGRPKRMKKITYGKQRETKNSAPEIEVVTNAMFEPPMHPRKQVKCFRDMSKYDHHQTSCAE